MTGERRPSTAAGELLRRSIRSLLHLELLLLLRRDPSRWMCVDALAASVDASAASVERALEELAAANLIDVRIASSLRFRFAPVEASIVPAIDEIASAYFDDRQGVEAQFARSGWSVARTFADVFRLRRKKPHG